MIQTGQIQDEYTRNYPEYAYRVPIKEDITLHSLDPNRVDPLSEYLRDTAMYLPSLKHKELLDYKIMIGPSDKGFCKVVVLCLPNEYTLTKEEKIVCEFFVNDVYMVERYKSVFNEALERAFGRKG